MASSKMRRNGRSGWGLAALPLLLACAKGQGSDSAQDEGARVESPCESDGQGDACAPHGGQSGTEGGGETVCGESQTRAPALDEMLEPLGRSLRDLAANLGAIATPGRWLATAAPNELSFELGPLAAAVETSSYAGGGLCDWSLDVQSVTIRTADGAIDGPLHAHIRRPDVNNPLTVVMDVAVSALPQTHLGPALWSLDVPWVQQWADVYQLAPRNTAATELVIAVDLGGPAPVLRAAAFESGAAVGVWDSRAGALPPGPPGSYVPYEPLASDCGGAEQFQTETLEYTPFSSASAALAGITGTWARCLDNAEAEHVGLRIQPDGSWQHVALESGELVARFGFGHEGFVHLTDTSSMNSAEGLFQVDLRPAARLNGPRSALNDVLTRASERALVFGSLNAGWPAAVYLPSALAVRSDPPLYADGERAGVAACAQGESGIVANPEESAAALTGEYVLCSGGLPDEIAMIRFGESSLELLREDGSVLAAPSYSVDGAYAPGGVNVQLGAGDQYRFWSVVVSSQPRKLWILESRDEWVDSAVFSALP